MNHTPTFWRLPRAFAFLCAMASLTTATSRAAVEDPAIGYWTTIDDDGKTAKSVVRIFEKNSRLYGNIVELFNPKPKDPKCDQCEGANKGKPILGMQIIWNLEKNGSEWSGGHILDPKNGKVYKCYIEVLDGGARLKVRGYIGIALLGRTQYWRHTKQP